MMGTEPDMERSTLELQRMVPEANMEHFFLSRVVVNSEPLRDSPFIITAGNPFDGLHAT